MSLTHSQREAALEMKARRISTFDISMALGLPRQELTRLFTTESLTTKIRADDFGFADENMELARNAEATRAAELWFCRMMGARWDIRRRDNQG